MKKSRLLGAVCACLLTFAVSSAYAVSYTIIDLGVLASGSQSAVGAALADRTVLITSSGETQKNVDLSLELLGRMAPDRFLITLNRGLPLDPLVTTTNPDDHQAAPGFGQRLGKLLKKSTGVKSI